MLSGFCYRSKVSGNGKRQILSFHIAGEMPDLHGVFLKKIDYDLTSLSPARVGFIDHAALEQVIDKHPQLPRRSGARRCWMQSYSGSGSSGSERSLPPAEWPIWSLNCASVLQPSDWPSTINSAFRSRRPSWPRRLD
ncbi:hypothetical protein [Bradyrhizobium sp. I1.14.4]|uniref:hypothetical protein n=1 Tax=unclassified Bradyrhizobium TaxID=2631580 RepID=UPI003D20EE17